MKTGEHGRLASITMTLPGEVLPSLHGGCEGRGRSMTETEMRNIKILAEARALPTSEEIRAKVWDVLTRRINPSVAAHGGHVDLIDVQDNTVFLQLGGGCQGCGMADVTLKQGIEVEIRAAVPEVGEILDTTDHA